MWLLVCATLAVIVALVYWALRSAAPAADKAAAPQDDDWAAQLSPAVAELIDPLVSLDHLQGLPAEDASVLAVNDHVNKARWGWLLPEMYETWTR